MESNIVKVNVGGRVFAVENQVLRSRGENMITRLLYNTAENGMEKSVDDEGNLFISGDPETFAVILDFLRLGKLHIPYNISWTRMQAELDYYCIDVSSSQIDASVCDSQTVKDGLCISAEDPTFGSKLSVYAALSCQHLAQTWVNENKKTMIKDLVSAAADGLREMGCYCLPLAPIPHRSAFVSVETSTDIKEALIRIVQSSLGVRVHSLRFSDGSRFVSHPDRLEFSISWVSDDKTTDTAEVR